jgi:hypothetical protein
MFMGLLSQATACLEAPRRSATRQQYRKTMPKSRKMRLPALLKIAYGNPKKTLNRLMQR